MLTCNMLLPTIVMVVKMSVVAMLHCALAARHGVMIDSEPTITTSLPPHHMSHETTTCHDYMS